MDDLEARRRSFDDNALAYEAERPGYPGALFDELLATAGVGPGASVLEIGCGTGKATRSLLDRGLRVTGIEFGANLAALALHQFAGRPLTIHVGRVEEWDAPRAAFDLAVCAQAYHWVEPALAGPRIAQALVPGGLLACFWNTDAERVCWLDTIYSACAPELDYAAQSPLADERIAQQRAHLEQGGDFEVVEVRRYPWTMRKSADEYVRLLDTYSEHRTLPEATRARLYPAIRAAIGAYGGTLKRAIVAYVLLARATGRR